jgi:hypothetical protein
MPQDSDNDSSTISLDERDSTAAGTDSSMSSVPLARTRGAQPGNLNALKHGLYSRQLRDMPTADIDALSAADLDSEIAMLRTLIARTLELSQDLKDVHDAVKVLGAMSNASGRLSSMLRTQKLLSAHKGDETLDAIDWALSEIIKEFDIK